jgi:hypothetical protein
MKIKTLVDAKFVMDEGEQVDSVNLDILNTQAEEVCDELQPIFRLMIMAMLQQRRLDPNTINQEEMTE